MTSPDPVREWEREREIGCDIGGREAGDALAAEVKRLREAKAWIKRDHPEGMCQSCGGPNVVWFAPNDVWNEVVGEPNGILCPTCFVGLARAKGDLGAWRVAPEDCNDVTESAMTLYSQAVRELHPLRTRYAALVEAARRILPDLTHRACCRLGGGSEVAIHDGPTYCDCGVVTDALALAALLPPEEGTK